MLIVRERDSGSDMSSVPKTIFEEGDVALSDYVSSAAAVANSNNNSSSSNNVISSSVSDADSGTATTSADSSRSSSPDEEFRKRSGSCPARPSA